MLIVGVYIIITYDMGNYLFNHNIITLAYCRLRRTETCIIIVTPPNGGIDIQLEFRRCSRTFVHVVISTARSVWKLLT